MKMKINAIVEKLLNLRIGKEQAVDEICTLFDASRDDFAGKMGDTERKQFVNAIKTYYKEYGYPTRGNTAEMKDYLDYAVRSCGFEDLSQVTNTKENRSKIEDALYECRSKFLG